MKITYKDVNFQGKTLKLIALADAIIHEYGAQGYDLTLRQLYYQLVARGEIPNSDKMYKKLGNTISDARLAGLIDWDAIVDRTRTPRERSKWRNPKEILRSARDSYHRDWWAGQEWRVEAWIEKDALLGVIAPICNGLDMLYFSCRGYVSQSEMWRASVRHIALEEKGQSPIVLHMGDHDPSGIDMTRDIQDRLLMFGANTEVVRIALTWEQVQQYNPPPNPAKVTDSRAAEYISQYGDTSWELDALPPNAFRDLIETHVLDYVDYDLFQEVKDTEEEERDKLAELERNYK